MNTFEQNQASHQPNATESIQEPPTAVGIIPMSVGPLWPIWLAIIVTPILVLAAPGLAVLCLAVGIFAGPYVLVRYVLGRK